MKNFHKEILQYSELGKNLDLTKNFQKFRIEQSDLVLFIISLFGQKELTREEIYYLIFNAYLIKNMLEDNNTKFVSIVVLNEKLDELYLKYYKDSDFLTLSAVHSNNKDLMNSVIFEMRNFFKDKNFSNETCLLAISALESIIDNFYEMRT